MLDLKTGAIINFIDGKRRAGHFILAARPFGQASYKGGFAAAQVADQLNQFTALQVFAQPLGELLGLLGIV